ncbi:Cpn10-domain-containing protein [Parathielavia appendiculata]|uniref:Cpn10-domain-containing protein n=1 Tax=Parathielavia appendiculata TaxID=2587402 RepID=A0AAN6TVQ4_9PEZI|nr:Cpn10-domain-containing protein [Parathielavia appendiculata]
MATSLRSIKSLVPLLDRVLVQRIKAEAKTAGGIFLPESSVKELNEAKVLAVGPGALDKDGKRMPMGVSAGDKVLIPQYGGSPVKVGEEEYHLFRDSEILAKINDPARHLERRTVKTAAVEIVIMVTRGTVADTGWVIQVHLP